MYISMTYIKTSASQVNVHLGHLGLLLRRPPEAKVWGGPLESAFSTHPQVVQMLTDRETHTSWL